jgi:hypothetical protein
MKKQNLVLAQLLLIISIMCTGVGYAQNEVVKIGLVVDDKRVNIEDELQLIFNING